ncbi:hypothetical protein [Acetivibrio mesophilus]|uniref:Uncharacterized protein n=1 Tax=Acetivibrio mesophilus TaxID=2487273 RepID=A0A4Q0I636_9FIRM|nr:hypothetical protein [Acetivibrio mesophilus]ODM26860.1 hypothetical protein A7W90_11900 [Clostridium sp. Bc-iso-3]RXE59275.1 hypothetical protein EFD62_07855 [Acetivibrio mesophilus]HHV28348.1 hypothetical protein [Clostridium sp.]
MRKNTITRFLHVQLLIIILLMIFLPLTASADIGPKPSLHIIAENMPDGVCYLDLLVNYTLEHGRPNISDEAKYDPKMLDILKKYNVDGWRPAMVTGTRVPMFGDIICDVKDGKCTMNFTYVGVPDEFKIIVVTADGRTVVSNVVNRKAFDSTVNFDFMTGEAAEHSAILSYFLQFLFTCSGTLVIEGIVLLLFRFNLKRNYKPFVAINVFTQILLGLAIFTMMYREGIMAALWVYVPFELIILMIEACLFVKFLKQHSETRRVLFAVVANIVSFAVGIALMLNPALW